MLTAILLASGFSKRMNTNKLLLPFENKILIEHIMNTICSCQFDEMIIVARDIDVINLAKNYPFKVIENKNANNGQSESIRLGVSITNEKSSFMFFVADQPSLSKNTIDLIIESHLLNLDKIIVPTFNYINKNPTIFPFIFRKELIDLKGDVGGRSIIKNNINKVKTIEINDALSFRDIDTIEDYLDAMTSISTKASNGNFAT